MPTARSSPLRSGLFLVLALLLGLAGCSVLSDGDGGPSPDASVSAPADVQTGLRAALDQRAQAVLSADAPNFLAGLTPGDRDLRRQQRTYFANLTQLPLGVFDYSLDPAGIVRQGEDYQAVVELHLQLTGFDERPVVTRDRFTFTPGPTPGGYVVAAAGDPAWEADHDVSPQP